MGLESSPHTKFPLPSAPFPHGILRLENTFKIMECNNCAALLSNVRAFDSKSSWNSSLEFPAVSRAEHQLTRNESPRYSCTSSQWNLYFCISLSFQLNPAQIPVLFHLGQTSGGKQPGSFLLPYSTLDPHSTIFLLFQNFPAMHN